MFASLQIQLDARRRKRQKRAREEHRRDKAINIEMDKQVSSHYSQDFLTF
jgi:hypothetical protein